LSVFLGASPAAAKKARVELNASGQPESPEERKERIMKERKEYEERRKQIEEKEKELIAGKEVKEAEMGSNLRGDYYYPTARKRYLPRVKRAYDELVPIRAELAANSADWDKINVYAKGHGDVSSALKLYVSALGGGGLSISSTFMGDMKTHAEEFDNAYKEFVEGVKGKKVPKALSAAEGMESALLAWREAGKPVGLTNDDWGVGEIPDCKRGVPGAGTGKMSQCATGSSFGNANPNLYNRNIKSE